MKNIIFATLAFSMTLPLTASANTGLGVLSGTCQVIQPGLAASNFNFSLESSENMWALPQIFVPVPLLGANPDIYTITVTNKAGIQSDFDRDVIEIGLTAQRTFCNPPILEEGGRVSATPCDRPRSWQTLNGVSKLLAPKDGDVLVLSQKSTQIEVSCQATFKAH